MGQPAAKQGDQITANDTHIELVPSVPGPQPTPMIHRFRGLIDGGLSSDVTIMGRPAATVGCTATNQPPHVPMASGASFQRQPTNLATIQLGSTTVFINGKPAAVNGSTALTCNDPTDLPVGRVKAAGTVFFGL